MLQSACYAELADLKTLEAVVLRGRAGDRLKEAAQLAPRNPRVVLYSAQQELKSAKPGSAERQRGFVPAAARGPVVRGQFGNPATMRPDGATPNVTWR